MEAFIGGIAATIAAAPIYAAIVWLLFRYWNKRRRKALKFLCGEWYSEYNSPDLDKIVIEKVQIKESLWKSSISIKSIESDPPEFAWSGELSLDENSTVFGAWENTSNPSWSGYCVFHLTREGPLVGYTIVTKRDHSAERSVKEWKLTRP